MKNYKKHIDAFIREKAGRNPENPPSHVWENLDKQLDGLAPSKPPVFYRRIQYFAIISALLLLTSAIVKTMIGNSRLETNKITAAKMQNDAATTGTVPNHGNNTAAVSPQSAPATAPTDTTPAAPFAEKQPPPIQPVDKNTTTAGAQNVTPHNTTGTYKHTGTQATASSTKITRQPLTGSDADKKGKEEVYADNNKKIPEIIRRRKQNTNTTANTITTPNTIASTQTSAGKKAEVRYRTKNGPTAVPPANNYSAATSFVNPNILNNNSGTISQPGNSGTVIAANNQSQAPAGAAGNNYAAAPGNGNANTTNPTQPTKDPNTAQKHPPVPSPDITKKENTVKPTTEKRKKEISKPLTRWEEGIKAGYENGFNSYAASKYAIAPYVQYNVSAKFSLMVQPAAKYAQSIAHNVGTPQQYYTVNDDGIVSQNGNSVLNPTGNAYTTNYTFSQSHDSIVKSYTAHGTYMEFELPLLMKYYIAKQLSVYGGINLMYSKQPGITEHTYEQDDILKTVNFNVSTPALPVNLPDPPNVPYTGTPFAYYNGPLYQAPSAGQFHIGYMVGFTYQYGKRWLFDALLEQSPVNPNVMGGYNINAPLSSFYWRTSIGYKFVKNHKEKLFGKKDTGRGD